MSYCVHCGKELKDGMAFCAHCGSKINKEEIKQPKKEKKRADKKVWIATVAVALVLVIGAGAFLLLKKPEEYRNNYAIYHKNGELYSANLENGESSRIGEAGWIVSRTNRQGYSPIRSQNGEGLIYKKEETLCYLSEKKGESVVIDDEYNGNWAEISADGNYVVYTKKNGKKEEFCKYDAKKDRSEVVYSLSLGEMGSGAYCCLATRNLDRFVFIDEEGNLFEVNQKGEAKEIDDEVLYIFEYYESGEMYYLDGENNLKYYDGKKSTILGKAWSPIEMIYQAKNLCTWAKEAAVIIYSEDGKEWYIAVRGEVSKFPEVSFTHTEKVMNDTYGIVLSDDGKKVYYLSGGDLCCADITKEGLKNKEIYQRNVQLGFLKLLQDGSIAYEKDGRLYINKKKISKESIAIEGMQEKVWEDYETGAIYYRTEGEKLIRYYKGKTETIASDVSYAEITTGGGVMYWSSGDVYCWIDGESILLDEDVAEYIDELIWGSKKKYYY